MAIVIAENPERAQAHLEELRAEQKNLALRVAGAPQNERSSYVAEMKDLSERIAIATSALSYSELRS